MYAIPKGIISTGVGTVEFQRRRIGPHNIVQMRHRLIGKGYVATFLESTSNPRWQRNAIGHHNTSISVIWTNDGIVMRDEWFDIEHGCSIYQIKSANVDVERLGWIGSSRYRIDFAQSQPYRIGPMRSSGAEQTDLLSAEGWWGDFRWELSRAAAAATAGTANSSSLGALLHDASIGIKMEDEYHPNVAEPIKAEDGVGTQQRGG
mmetsp:Transcript_6847/g.14944  ORF Transcript_6847/g.14944 Transcript_6847/m.14944 type:complete len:205 (-) Transcript_6847:474-1088(-)